MSNEGYIKIYRQIRDWKWYSDGPTKDVFLHLLVTASFEDKFYRGIAVKRGQSVLTVEEIREETGLTVRQIRTAINRLISTNEVTKQATYKFTVYTINNYEHYQSGGNLSDKPTTNQRQTNDKPLDTKNVKNVKNTPYTPQGGDAISPRFDTFWSAYPRKTGKADARKKFEKLVTDESTLSAILKSLEYLKTTEQWQKDSGKYIPYPATWLNQKRWEDETAQPPAEPRRSEDLIPIYDREYTREDLINGVVPKLIGWKEVGK